MTRILFVFALGGVAFGQADLTAGQQPICGLVTSARTLGHGACDLHLTLQGTLASPPLDVVIPDATRKKMPARVDYFHEDICVSGTVGTDRPEPYVLVTAPSQIEMKSHHNAVPFGGDAADTCDAGIEPPRMLKDRKPSYTEEAMRQRIEGTVLMDVVVGADGKVTTARVTRSLDPGLDEQALRSVKQFEFQAGRRDGTPVNVIVSVEMTFSLRLPNR